ncbi:dual specificity protein phosphatase 3-like [Crassostrea virginica]
MAKSGKSNPATCTPEELDEIITAPSGGIQMLPSNAYDEVYPGIYIGEESIGKSRIGLRDMGITHVVNTAMGKGQFHVNTNHVMFKRVGIQFYGFEAMDMLNFQLTPFFEKSANFIEQALNEEGKVMVHCKVGASRSATIVLAFLMIKRYMTVQEAVRMVRAKREIAPNEGFLQQLCDLNDKLYYSGYFDKKPT